MENTLSGWYVAAFLTSLLLSATSPNCKADHLTWWIGTAAKGFVIKGFVLTRVVALR